MQAREQRIAEDSEEEGEKEKLLVIKRRKQM
jgi:hypothetical protein